MSQNWADKFCRASFFSHFPLCRGQNRTGGCGGDNAGPMNFGPIFGQVYTFSCFMGRVIGNPKLWLFVSNAANLECMRGRKEKANIYSPHSAVNTNIPVLNGPLD